MAVVKAPCMSLRARGTFHQLLTFSGCRSTAVAKRKNRGSNPDTIPQRGHRTMLKCVANLWSTLIPPATASWVNNLPADEFSAYHWFVKFNMARWRLGKGPCVWFGNQDTGSTPSMTSWGIAVHQNYVRLVWPPAGFADIHTATWHRGSPLGYTPTPATAIETRYWPQYRFATAYDHPLIPGLYRYRLVLHSFNGVSYLQPDSKSALIT